MAKKQNTTNTNEATEAKSPSRFERATTKVKATLLAGINIAAKSLTIIDVIARITLGIAVWFVTVPQFMSYAATFLGVVGLLQALHMLWKAQK